jgi:hypothetical protein
MVGEVELILTQGCQSSYENMYMIVGPLLAIGLEASLILCKLLEWLPRFIPTELAVFFVLVRTSSQ